MRLPFTDMMDNFRRYGPLSSTQDIVKALAIVIMVIDHVGYIFFPQHLWWRSVGRIGFPVWFFLAGYACPSRPPYLILFLSFLMVLTDFYVGEKLLPINALLSIFCCRLFVSSTLVNLPLTAVNWGFTLFFILITTPFSMLFFEYGPLALLFALCGFYCRFHHQNPLTRITLTISMIIFVMMQQHSFGFSTLQCLFMMLGTGTVTTYLWFYRVKEVHYSTLTEPLQPAVNFLARNSHYVYAIHFIFFLFVREVLQISVGKH